MSGGTSLSDVNGDKNFQDAINDESDVLEASKAAAENNSSKKPEETTINPKVTTNDSGLTINPICKSFLGCFVG